MGCCPSERPSMGNNKYSTYSKDMPVSLMGSKPIESKELLLTLKEAKEAGNKEEIEEILYKIKILAKEGRGDEILEGMEYIGMEEEANNIRKSVNKETSEEEWLDAAEISNVEGEKDEEIPPTPKELDGQGQSPNAKHNSFSDDDDDDDSLEEAGEENPDQAFVWKAPPKYLMDRQNDGGKLDINVAKKKSQFFQPTDFAKLDSDAYSGLSTPEEEDELEL